MTFIIIKIYVLLYIIYKVFKYLLVFLYYNKLLNLLLSFF
jgi:hypothetical protein